MKTSEARGKNAVLKVVGLFGMKGM